MRLARKEIQAHLDGLEHIFIDCNNDQNLHEKSVQIEKHLHSIKGLAPMMGQDSVGELARISDIIVKFIITNGRLDGSQKILLGAIQKMNHIFNGSASFDTTEFRNTARDTLPQVSGL